MKAKYKVLFVCLGNICRSPSAEGIMKKLLKDEGLSGQIDVESAGLLGFHEGELPDQRAREHASARGYTLDSLSRPIVAADFEMFDLIIGMDNSNYNRLRDMAPDLETMGKVRRMREYLRHHTHDHIPDPYSGGSKGFELVLDLLEDGCQGLLDELKAAFPQDS